MSAIKYILMELPAAMSGASMALFIGQYYIQSIICVGVLIISYWLSNDLQTKMVAIADGKI
jgi:hypothetical protein